MSKIPIRSKLKNVKGQVDGRLDALMSRAEKEREHRASVRTAFGVVESNRRTAASLLAGGLAYRFFLWALPFSLFASSFLHLVADVSEESPAQLAKELGMGAAMAQTIGRAANAAGRNTIVLMLIGLALMVWAGRTVWNAVRVASQLAWQVPVEKANGWVRSTLGATAVLIGFGLLNVVASLLYAGRLLTDAFATLLVIAVITAALTLVGQVLPHAEGVSWRGFVPGSFLFAVGAEGLRLATAVYLAGRLTRADDLYGALGLAAVFMAFLYLLGRLVMLWLLVNAEWHRSRETS